MLTDDKKSDKLIAVTDTVTKDDLVHFIHDKLHR